MEYDLIPAAAPLLCKTVDVLMLERHDRFFSERARREGWRVAPGQPRSSGHARSTAEPAEGRRRIERLNRALRTMARDSTCLTKVKELPADHE